MEPASNRLLRPDRLTPTCWTHQITDYADNPIDCPGHTKTHTNKGGHIVSLAVTCVSWLHVKSMKPEFYLAVKVGK